MEAIFRAKKMKAVHSNWMSQKKEQRINNNIFNYC